MAKKETKKAKKQEAPVLGATIEMCTHRPELAPAFMIGVQSLLKVFKTEYKEAITDFLTVCEHEFFASLDAMFKNQYPEVAKQYSFGQTVVNKSGQTRYIVGVGVSKEPNNKGKYTPMYEYYDPNAVVSRDKKTGRALSSQYGICSEVTMKSWSEK